MSTDHLAEQFAGILGHAAEQGVEFPPEMPGMARIGGLHVPVANVHIAAYDPDGNFKDGIKNMNVHIPDERGNMFSLHTTPMLDEDEFGGTTQHGNQPVKVPSAEAFANMYGNLDPTDGWFKEENNYLLEKFHGIQPLMGIGTGQAQGNSDHVYDLRSGAVAPARMHYYDAWQEWNNARKRRDSEGGQ